MGRTRGPPEGGHYEDDVVSGFSRTSQGRLKMRTAIAVAVVAALAGSLSAQTPGRAVQTLDNARVRAFRTTAGVLEGVPHGPGVVIWLADGPKGTAGHAAWVDDASVPPPDGAGSGEIVIIQLRPPSPTPPSAGSKPGDAPFTGMSFVPQFENDRVSVLRARMEVGAREGFHTHGSDTIVVH